MLQTQSCKKFVTFILEILLIILSVFIGLVANEMRVSHNKKQQAYQILRYVSDEIDRNSARIFSVLDYHHEMSNSLRKLANEVMNSKKIVTYQDILRAMPKGFIVPSMEFSGQNMLINTGSINVIDLDLGFQISRVYLAQEYLVGKINKIGENFYIASNNDPQKLGNLSIAISFLASDIVIQEEKLKELYSEIKKRLANEK